MSVCVYECMSVWMHARMKMAIQTLNTINSIEQTFVLDIRISISKTYKW